MTATTETIGVLPKVWRHPVHRVEVFLGLIVAALIGAHVGKFIIIALYYLVIEGAGHAWWLTHQWHHLIGGDPATHTHAAVHAWLSFTKPADRHMVRTVFEGLYGGLLGFVFAWNAFKKSIAVRIGVAPVRPVWKHTPAWNPIFAIRALHHLWHWFWYLLDKVEIALRIPNLRDPRRLTPWQLLVSPFWVLIYATPGLALAVGVQRLIDSIWHNPTLSATLGHGTLGQVMTQLYTSNWYQIVAGLFASYFLGKRPAFKVANDIQLWFAERREKVHGGTPRFYDTWAFKERLKAVRAVDTTRSTIGHNDLAVAGMLTLSVVLMALAGYGAYVLFEIIPKAH